MGLRGVGVRTEGAEDWAAEGDGGTRGLRAALRGEDEGGTEADGGAAGLRALTALGMLRAMVALEV